MDKIINSIEYISLFIGSYLTVIMVFRLLNLLQQSHYHYNGFNSLLKYYYLLKGIILIPLAGLLWFLNLWFVQMIYLLYAGFLIWYLIKNKPIVKLKITPRIKRLSFMILIVGIAAGTLLLYFLSLPQLIAALVIIYIALPLIIFIAFNINYPLEYLISKYYQQLAKNKLNRYNTIVIGITGSYGKTSTKNILYSYLKEKEIILASEKSYNTLNGIALNINQKLFPEHRYFIAEMGASRKGDISKLNSILKPKFGIITAIGPQHLKTFKSGENIISEKMKLIEALPASGIGVINVDDKAVNDYNLKTAARIVTFGINSKADYSASSIKSDMEGLCFTVNYPGGKTDIKTELLGKHNVYNILAAFALANELGILPDEIAFHSMRLEPVKNRLSIRGEGDITILEDAFNSNYNGFINALSILEKASKYKILITPGIVEAGSMEKKLNLMLADKIKDKCDLVILIKSKTGMIIKSGFDSCGYSSYVIKDNYMMAIKYVKDHFPQSTVLVENDISDIYKM